MCKIVVFTSASRLNISKAATKIGNILLKLEQDGFGYAVQGAQGVFGERCIASTFESRHGRKVYPIMPTMATTVQTFGTMAVPTGAAIFHGRTSTNQAGLINTHPMQHKGWHLVHNGVVTDYGPKYAKTTQNDSEDVLVRLVQGIAEVEKHLGGYYAFAAIDTQGQLHLARDNQATLFSAWSEHLKSFIIGTTHSLVVEVAKAIGVKIGPVETMQDNIYSIMQGNETMHTQTIKPRGWGAYEAGLAGKSLGRNISYGEYGTEAWETNNYGTTYEPKSFTSSEARYATEAPMSKPEARREAYEDWLREVENMDAAYTIENPDGLPLNIYEFDKLDYIAQEMCTITRPDGTALVCPLYAGDAA